VKASRIAEVATVPPGNREVVAGKKGFADPAFAEFADLQASPDLGFHFD
jgi:hypothetical protein